MQRTILYDSAARVITLATVSVIAALPLVQWAGLADPFQAPRALVAALCLAVLFITAAVRPVSRFRRRLWAGVAAAIFSVLVLSGSLANHPASSVWGVMGRFQGLVTAALLVVAGVAGAITLRRRAPALFNAISVILLAEAGLIVIQAVTGGPVDGTFGNRALAAAWMAVGTAVAAASAAALRSRWRWVHLIAATLGLVAIGVTGTRGAWLGVAAGLMALFAVSGRSLRRSTVLVAGTVGVALVVLGAAIGGSESVSKLSPAQLLTGSAASRFEIWRGTLSMIAERPLTGIGTGRFIYEFPRFESTLHARAEGADIRADNAHNVVLHYAAESGAPAALAFLVVAACALVQGLRGARERDGVALVAVSGLAAWLGQALVGVPAIETDLLAWLFGGLALSVPLARAGDSSEVTKGSRPSARRAVHVLLQASLALAAISIAASCVRYVSANAAYAQGLRQFEQGRISSAAALFSDAIEQDPLTDNYRVALTDAALYQRDMLAALATRAVVQGLEYEPTSFDLLMSRGRLVDVPGGNADESARAYLAAVEVYPLSVEARHQAIEALLRAGRRPDAVRMARDVLLVAPNDPVASQIVD